jgi:tRNA(adenine34) deaminase
MMADALRAAREGLAAGELPVGAVVYYGTGPYGRAHSRESAEERRLAHPEMLALTGADRALGWKQTRHHGLRLVVTVEPCLMCVGAAMAPGVHEIYYGVESPDGCADLVAQWQPRPQMPAYRPPTIVGGVRREECLDLFRDYCETTPDTPFRRWAQTFLDLPPR